MARDELLIVFYNSQFGHRPRVPETCATPCTFSFDPAAAQEADALVFHLPTLGNAALPPKRPGQLFVAWSMESRANYPLLDDPAFMARFDLTMSYERASDVWVPYFGPGTVPGLRREPMPKTAAAPVVFLQSNPHDRCGRLRYSAELMTRVRIDSYGRVHRNQTERVPPGWDARQSLYCRYKFTLAFENSFAPDYVTEKLFEPLTAGSVPVYRGCADVAELAPAPGCYIDSSDFSSPRELAAYLNHLATHDKEYGAFHRWREEPFAPLFRRYLVDLADDQFCRLAKTVVARQAAAGGREGGDAPRRC